VTASLPVSLKIALLAAIQKRDAAMWLHPFFCSSKRAGALNWSRLALKPSGPGYSMLADTDLGDMLIDESRIHGSFNEIPDTIFIALAQKIPHGPVFKRTLSFRHPAGGTGGSTKPLNEDLRERGPVTSQVLECDVEDNFPFGMEPRHFHGHSGKGYF
jgi:hypothetical protein